jgi:hypothetical protein
MIFNVMEAVTAGLTGWSLAGLLSCKLHTGQQQLLDMQHLYSTIYHNSIQAGEPCQYSSVPMPSICPATVESHA